MPAAGTVPPSPRTHGLVEVPPSPGGDGGGGSGGGSDGGGSGGGGDGGGGGGDGGGGNVMDPGTPVLTDVSQSEPGRGAEVSELLLEADASAGSAQLAPPVTPPPAAAANDSNATTCWICLDFDCDAGGGLLLPGGCGCRGGAGHAHLSCVATHAAMHHGMHREDASGFDGWLLCPTCKQGCA